MEMFFGVGLFVAGCILFAVALVTPDDERTLVSRLMRSEFSALLITILFGFGMALATDSAMGMGSNVIAVGVIAALGVVAILASRIGRIRPAPRNDDPARSVASAALG